MRAAPDGSVSDLGPGGETVADGLANAGQADQALALVELHDDLLAKPISPLVETVADLAAENGRLTARVAQIDRQTNS
jgi:hypothetical protein